MAAFTPWPAAPETLIVKKAKDASTAFVRTVAGARGAAAVNFNALLIPAIYNAPAAAIKLGTAATTTAGTMTPISARELTAARSAILAKISVVIQVFTAKIKTASRSVLPT